jgi:CrcB protein
LFPPADAIILLRANSQHPGNVHPGNVHPGNVHPGNVHPGNVSNAIPLMSLTQSLAMEISIQKLALVFLGGGWGSISRYLITQVIRQQFGSLLPWGTLFVNVVGCGLIGVVLALVEDNQWDGDQGLLLATGFCGEFTTFSSFAYENRLLWDAEDFPLSLIYTALSFSLGMVATGLGIWLVRRWVV